MGKLSEIFGRSEKLTTDCRKNKGTPEFTWQEISGIDSIPEIPSQVFPKPGIVTQHGLCSQDFYFWVDAIKERPKFHRKQWEYFLALQTIWASSGGNLHGKKAILFGVGLDPIAAVLASLGMDVKATDFRGGANAAAWKSTGQLSEDMSDLNARGICSREDFLDRCSYEEVDMSAIPNKFRSSFDYSLSFCSLGHIGGYREGLDFVEQSGKVLRPGGIAVHTTEIDLSEHLPVLESPNLSLYRSADLKKTLQTLTEQGYQVPDHSFKAGPGLADSHLDKEPYSSTHLRFELLGHETTAFGFVFSKSPL